MVAKKRASSPKKKRLLITDVVQRYLRDVETTREENTLVLYRYRVGTLVRLLTDVCQLQYLDEVEVDHLRECLQCLQKMDLRNTTGRRRVPDNGSTYAVSTIRGFIRIWKAFFSWCLQEGLIETNPADVRFKAPKPEKKIKPTFAEEQIYKMLAVFDTSGLLGFRNYVILIVFLDTGVRLEELATLQLKDVHEEYIKVNGKGRKEREIGICPDTYKLIWKYISQYRIPADDTATVLFLTCWGNNMSVSAIKSIVKRVRQESGLTDIQVSPHVFRHTFAKMSKENGGDVLDISREMGHSDVQITKLYLEDFGSAEARRGHNSRSPISRLNLKKQHNRKSSKGKE